jgi:hypothetical protein
MRLLIDGDSNSLDRSELELAAGIGSGVTVLVWCGAGCIGFVTCADQSYIRTAVNATTCCRVSGARHDRHVFASRRIFVKALIFALPFKRIRVMNRHAPTGRRKGQEEST